MSAALVLDRRRLLAGGGALIVSFSLGDAFAQGQNAPAATPAPSLPGSLKGAPFLDSWIRIDADGSITAFTERPSSARVSRPRFSRSPRKNSMCRSNP